MKNLILKTIGFLILIVFLFYANLFVFRSEMPSLVFITIIGSVVLFIIFPYNKYFKQNEKR